MIGFVGVISLITAVEDIYRGVGEETVSGLDPLHRVDLRGGDGVEVRRESLVCSTLKTVYPFIVRGRFRTSHIWAFQNQPPLAGSFSDQFDNS